MLLENFNTLIQSDLIIIRGGKDQIIESQDDDIAIDSHE